MHILIVDDEKTLVKGLKRSLETEGYQVSVAFEGEEALKFINHHTYDLIILDLMLPKIDGISLCRMIRQKQDTPIIMLTARDGDIDKILGLEMGADDYMTKPFNTRELIARVRAILRRVENQSEITEKDQVYYSKDIELDTKFRTIKKAGTEIELTQKEFDILSLLIRNKGRVFPREEIFQLIWEEPCYDTRTIDVHIKNIREKLKDHDETKQIIQTKWGVGYFFRRD
ncbi:response regulator transcription factor [Serpentinicella sp. ANB-PHB4]|uniref:response regulator transcription factor n=1 Tax=Serpentinicella sp. ANB-PHB4 TaxID=3074076 RepID=UPI0028608D20|nr:response regulator transcription factor [Serpentinicella sp. ANB-PHB4]MDR5659696.1 response regulator transcription factor [Serpentinicella sp. ANB-PHB4]